MQTARRCAFPKLLRRTDKAPSKLLVCWRRNLSHSSREEIKQASHRRRQADLGTRGAGKLGQLWADLPPLRLFYKLSLRNLHFAQLWCATGHAAAASVVTTPTISLRYQVNRGAAPSDRLPTGPATPICGANRLSMANY